MVHVLKFEYTEKKCFFNKGHLTFSQPNSILKDQGQVSSINLESSSCSQQNLFFFCLKLSQKIYLLKCKIKVFIHRNMKYDPISIKQHCLPNFPFFWQICKPYQCKIIIPQWISFDSQVIPFFLCITNGMNLWRTAGKNTSPQVTVSKDF